MKRTLLLIGLAWTAQGAAAPAGDAAQKPLKLSVVKITPAVPIGDPNGWVTNDDYPAEAMRSGSKGLVNFTLAIDETGKVADCGITESSGNQTLDDATCALMMARARFVPAHDEKERPVATTFHRKVRWILPGGTREIWTLDQIRLPTPKNAQLLASLAADTSMDAVAKRLKALGIAFERGAAQLDTAIVPDPLIERVKGLPATEPFLMPQAGVTTVNVITARKPVDFDGSAAKPILLLSPQSEQATISFDVDPDGKQSNCMATGETPLWLTVTALCKAFEARQPNFSPDPKKQIRHFAMTVQVSVTSTAPSLASSPTK